MTVRYSASWMNSAQTTIHSDSRTGEILNASILINANMISVQYADRVGATVAIDPRVRTTVFPEDIQGELIRGCYRSGGRYRSGIDYELGGFLCLSGRFVAFGRLYTEVRTGFFRYGRSSDQ